MEKEMEVEKGKFKTMEEACVELPFTFSQTLTEMTVRVPVPVGTKGKQVICKIKRDTLLLQLVGQDQPIIEGEFWKPVKKDDCLWSIEDSKTVVLELAKTTKQEWWPCVIKGHPQIDTRFIEPENSKLTDLDGETRGMVEKMMYDQQRKQMGLPTSDEEQKEAKLQEFMKMHPEMDFSNAKINYS